MMLLSGNAEGECASSVQPEWADYLCVWAVSWMCWRCKDAPSSSGWQTGLQQWCWGCEDRADSTSSHVWIRILRFSSLWCKSIDPGLGPLQVAENPAWGNCFAINVVSLTNDFCLYHSFYRHLQNYFFRQTRKKKDKFLRRYFNFYLFSWMFRHCK